MGSQPLRNGILRALPRADLETLLPLCARRELVAGEIVEHRRKPVESVLFPVSGVASVVVKGARGKALETGPIGWEGMTGLPIVYGVDNSPAETMVQIAGEAIAAPADAVKQIMAASPATREVFTRYAYAFSLQIMHTALAAGLSSLDCRLARWILMLHDRVEGDLIDATHEFISMMLGVRRPGVTVALHVLEGENLIRSRRRTVEVIDREGLIAKCGLIYGEPEREYQRVIGPQLKSPQVVSAHTTPPEAHQQPGA